MGTEQIYSEEQVENILSLGNVLREIRARLKRDGVSIDDARKNLRSKKQRKNPINENYVSGQRQNKSI